MENWIEIMDTIRKVPLKKTLHNNYMLDTPENRFAIWRKLLSQAETFLRGKKQWRDYIQKAVTHYQMYIVTRKDLTIDWFIFLLDYEGPISERTTYFPLTMVGLQRVGLYFVRSLASQQIIITIGEDHTVPNINNTSDILKTLVKNMDCPIDVLVERPHTPLKLSPTKANSLISYFNNELAKCFIKGYIPRQQKITEQSNKDYYRECVKPYQGKIKLWGTDIRQMSWFRWFNYILYPEDPDQPYGPIDRRITPDIIEYTKKLFSVTFDYDYFLTDRDGYDKTVRHGYHYLLERVADVLGERITKNRKLQQMISRMQTHEKDHLRFMGSLSFFSPETARYICGTIQEECQGDKFNMNNMLFSIADASMYIRTARLVRENKNRVLLLFMGMDHMNDFHRLLTKFPYVSYKDDPVDYDTPVIRSFGLQDVPAYRISIMLKHLPKDKTVRMQSYQKIQQREPKASSRLYS